jgi:hypothetical protein
VVLHKNKNINSLTVCPGRDLELVSVMVGNRFEGNGQRLWITHLLCEEGSIVVGHIENENRKYNA